MKWLRFIWIPFSLYFIAVHPALIYYNIHYYDGYDDKSPTWALVLLGVAVIGWIAVIILAGRQINRHTFGIYRDTQKLLREGRTLEGTIEKSELIRTRPGVGEDRELEVSFKNFSGTKITYPIQLIDSKPQMKRHEIGKSIRLKVDPELKYRPFVLPEGAEITMNKKRAAIMYGLWALAILIIVGYFIYAYQTESHGYGWRFLSLYHPLLSSLARVMLFYLVYHYVIDKMIFSKLLSNTGKKAVRLLFYGHRATAFITDAAQTGTYINENPQVRFDLTFTDHKGNTHKTSLKKVVYMIDLHDVKRESRPVLYMPDDPSVMMFEEDLG